MKSPQEKKSPKDAKKEGKRASKKVNTNFAQYIHKVLKQVHFECTISKRSMSIMNSFVNDVFERLANEASRPGVCFLKSQHFSENKKMVKTFFKKLIAFIFSVFFKMRKKVKVKELKKLLAFLADEDLR